MQNTCIANNETKQKKRANLQNCENGKDKSHYIEGPLQHIGSYSVLFKQ